MDDRMIREQVSAVAGSAGNRIDPGNDLTGMDSPPSVAPRTLTRRFRTRALAAFAGGLLAFSACGGSDDSGNAGSSAADSGLSGIVRDPPPQVDAVTLPSLSEPGEEVAFRAEPGGVEVVYFGYTTCPDVCPTTMSDFAIALRRMEPDDAARVETVMVTVDPDRDLDLLDGYVTSFVPDAVAAGTADTELLARSGEPFGASWDVRADGDTVEVDHSPFLYVVDDQGQLVLTWQFGTSSEDMASDLTTLLERAEA